jgi:hypothetical protein
MAGDIYRMTICNLEISTWTEAYDSDAAEFVAGHPEGLIYYTPVFRDYLVKMLGARSLGRLVLENGRVVGVMPLLALDGPYGTVINSLPFFGSNGGLLAGTAEAEQTLRKEYQKLALGDDIALSVWISHPFIEVQSPAHEYQDERIAQWTELTGEWVRGVPGCIDPSARRNVGKAESSGILVREAPDAMDFLEEVHRENMATIGGSAKPQDFFLSLPETMTYGRDWRLYVAERNGEKLAALLTFEAGRTVEYVMPAVRESARGLQPTAAILAKAMGDARNRGFTRWNWGGTWLTQEGVYRFKKKWGASERRYSYFIKLNDKSLLELTAKQLVDAYPWFYTLPYHLLRRGAES